MNWRPCLAFMPEVFPRKSCVPKFSILCKGEAMSEVKTQIPRTDSFLARELESPVVLKLRKSGFLRRQFDNEVEITCPRCGGVGIYIFPSESTPLIGNYVCKCGMSTAALLSDLRVSEFEADWRDKIVVREGEFRYVVLTIQKRLSESGQIFRSCGQLVEIVDRGTQIEKHFFTKETVPMLVSRFLSCYKKDLRLSGDQKLKPIDLPERIGKAVLCDVGNNDEIAHLRDVVECPIVTADGRVKRCRGYDKESQFWVDIAPNDFESWTETVSMEDAQKAYGRLRTVLAGVSFAQESDEVAAIASLLCAVLKPTISACPLVHIFATTPGAGKSTLTRALAMVPTKAGDATYLSFPTSEEEMQRLLASVLRRRPKVIVFDNVSEDLAPYGALCTCLTEGRFSARILGSSTVVDVNNSSMFISNGNNIRPRLDLVRRTLVIELAPNSFRPVERSQPIEEVVSRQRTKIIIDALVIYRAWLLAGARKFEAFPSFPEWDRQCRFPLLWLGKPDPLQRTYDPLRKDDGSEEVSDLLALLRKRFKGKTFKVADIRCWLEKEAEDDALKKAKAIFERWELLEEGCLNVRKAGRQLLRVAQMAHAEFRLEIVHRQSPVSFRVTEAI